MPVPPLAQLLRELRAAHGVGWMHLSSCILAIAPLFPHPMAADDDLPPVGAMELLPVILMLLGACSSLVWALGRGHWTVRAQPTLADWG